MITYTDLENNRTFLYWLIAEHQVLGTVFSLKPLLDRLKEKGCVPGSLAFGVFVGMLKVPDRDPLLGASELKSIHEKAVFEQELPSALPCQRKRL